MRVCRSIMNGYRVKFNGIDRLYDDYSWRLTRRAKKVWSSGNVLQGRYLAKLEEEVAKKYKRKFAIGVGSATDGLYFALKALGIKENDNVVCPALSYVATAGAIKRAGATADFVDTNDIGNIGELGVIGLPKAVLYVNLFGNLANYERLRTYCDTHKIPLIEDAAQSQGAMYGNTPSGKLGDVSVFSFDPMKNMPSFGAGGMVLTDNEDVYHTVRSLRRHGIGTDLPYGYNSLISEDHAHQLLLILDRFDRLQRKRRNVFQRYKKNLPEARFLETPENTQSSYHKLVLLSENRNNLVEFLARDGIETKIHYRDTLDPTGEYKTAQNICNKAVSLPMHPYLEKHEIDYVCESIKRFNNV